MGRPPALRRRRSFGGRARAEARPGLRAHDRPYGRNRPAHLANQSRSSQPGAGAGGAPGSSRRRGPVRLHRSRPALDRAAPDRRARADRWGRHALVCAAAPRRRGSGHRDPEDDGQRRPRNRLLHRVLDRSHARRPVHPQPPNERREPRAPGGRRALRALFGRDVAGHGVPRRCRPRGHLGGSVRSRPLGRTPRRRQALRTHPATRWSRSPRVRQPPGGSLCSPGKPTPTVTASWAGSASSSARRSTSAPARTSSTSSSPT